LRTLDVQNGHVPERCGWFQPGKRLLDFACLEHDVIGVAGSQIMLEKVTQPNQVQTDRLNALP
jgi:hypothetical protein